jgi:methylglyoxal reductase
MRLEVEASLKRLNVEAIDLLQVHKPAIEPQLTPIEETMGCLLDLKREGKVRAIGVSNVSMEQLGCYQTYGNLDTQQCHYNMLNRGARAHLPAVLPRSKYCISYLHIFGARAANRQGHPRSRV